MSNKFFAGIFLLLLLQWLGEGIKLYFALLIPGPVIGLVLLFCLLSLLALFQKNNIIEQSIEPASHFLLSHLSLFFFPALVAVVIQWRLYSEHLSNIAITMLLSTFFALIISARLYQFFARTSDSKGDK